MTRYRLHAPSTGREEEGHKQVVTCITPASIPLAGNESLGHVQLQERLGNVLTSESCFKLKLEGGGSRRSECVLGPTSRIYTRYIL